MTCISFLQLLSNGKQELPAYVAACNRIALNISKNGGQGMKLRCYFGLLVVPEVLLQSLSAAASDVFSFLLRTAFPEPLAFLPSLLSIS